MLIPYWKTNEYKAAKVKNWRKRHVAQVRATARLNQRARRLRSLGMTEDDYQKVLKKQKSKCAACGKKPTHKLGLMLDHNHKTNKFRALLCGHCNTILGHAKDSPNLLRKLAKYLEKFK